MTNAKRRTSLWGAATVAATLAVAAMLPGPALAGPAPCEPASEPICPAGTTGGSWLEGTNETWYYNATGAVDDGDASIFQTFLGVHVERDKRRGVFTVAEKEWWAIADQFTEQVEFGPMYDVSMRGGKGHRRWIIEGYRDTTLWNADETMVVATCTSHLKVKVQVSAPRYQTPILATVCV